FYVVFFFSSRRRHTRFSRDWSSDVCSSDLEVGALTRVTGLFSTRGYNIESLNVAPTDDPTVSRVTLVTTGTPAVIQQIVNQSLKLIDVVNVDDMTRDQHVERELLLLKLRTPPSLIPALRASVEKAGGKILSDDPED